MLTGPRGEARRGQGHGPGARAEAAGGALRRALHPPGAAPGHAHPGRQLRARPHHRGGARPRRAATRPGATASPTTCWASARRPPPTPSAISSATWRPSRRSARPAPVRGALTTQDADGAARHLGEALGHPSALRSRQGGAARRASCCRASSSSPPPPAGTASASPSTPRSRTASISTLGLFAAAFIDPALDGLAGPRPRRAGLRQARHPGAALAAPHGRAQAASGSPCGSSRAPTGTARSSGRRSAGLPTIPCSRARSTPTCPISPACGCCWPTRTAFYPAVRHPQRPVDRLGQRRGAGAGAYEFQRLHGMGEALYEEVVGSGKLGAHLPHLCAGRPARGPGRLSRAPPARERRQHLLRQPPGRRGGAHRRDHPRSRRRRGGGEGARQAAAPAAAAAGDLRARARQQPRHGADRARPCAERLLAQIGTELEDAVRGRAPRRRQDRTAGKDAPSLVLCPHDRRQRVGTVRTADAAHHRDRDRQRVARRTPGTGSAARRAPQSWSAPPTSTSATACG